MADQSSATTHPAAVNTSQHHKKKSGGHHSRKESNPFVGESLVGSVPLARSERLTEVTTDYRDAVDKYGPVVKTVYTGYDPRTHATYTTKIGLDDLDKLGDASVDITVPTTAMNRELKTPFTNKDLLEQKPTQPQHKQQHHHNKQHQESSSAAAVPPSHATTTTKHPTVQTPHVHTSTRTHQSHGEGDESSSAYSFLDAYNNKQVGWHPSETSLRKQYTQNDTLTVKQTPECRNCKFSKCTNGECESGKAKTCCVECVNAGMPLAQCSFCCADCAKNDWNSSMGHPCIVKAQRQHRQQLKQLQSSPSADTSLASELASSLSGLDN